MALARPILSDENRRGPLLRRGQRARQSGPNEQASPPRSCWRRPDVRPWRPCSRHPCRGPRRAPWTGAGGTRAVYGSGSTFARPGHRHDRSRSRLGLEHDRSTERPVGRAARPPWTARSRRVNDGRSATSSRVHTGSNQMRRGRRSSPRRRRVARRATSAHLQLWSRGGSLMKSVFV